MKFSFDKNSNKIVEKLRIYLYRPEKEVEILENPAEMSGEPLLKGFTLNLKEIWE